MSEYDYDWCPVCKRYVAARMWVDLNPHVVRIVCHNATKGVRCEASGMAVHRP